MDEDKIDQYIANFLDGKKLTGEEHRGYVIHQEGKDLARDLKILYGQDEQINIALYAYYKELLVWATNNGISNTYDLSVILVEGTNLLNRYFPFRPKGPEDLLKMREPILNGVEDIKFQNMIENSIHIITEQMDANAWKDFINYVDYFNDHWVNQMENPTFDITLPLEENIKKGEFAMPTLSDDELMETYNDEFLIKQRDELKNLLVGEYSSIQYAGGKYNGLVAVKNLYGTFDLYEPKPRYYTDYTDPDNPVENKLVEMESLSYSVNPGEPDENFPRFTNLTAQEIYHEPMNRIERLRWNKKNKLRPNNTAFGSTSSDDDALSRQIKKLEEDKKAIENVLRTSGLSEEEVTVAKNKLKDINDEIEEMYRLQTSLADGLVDYNENPEYYTGEKNSYDIDITDPDNPVIKPLELRGLTELESETKKFKDYILDKYKDYIAEDPGETTTFASSLGTGRESFDMTVLGDGKYIYIDMLAIKPSMQGQKAGTKIVNDIIKFAEKYDAHVIAIPATDTVRLSMLSNGGKYLPAGYVYFGNNYEQAIADQNAIVSTSQLETQFEIFSDFINNLDDIQITAAGLDKPTLDFINAVRTRSVNYQSYVDNWLPQIQTDLFSIVQRAGILENSIDEVRERNKNYFKEWSNLVTEGEGSFAKWITETPTGKAYIDSLAERLVDAYYSNPNIQIDVQNLYDNVMKDLKQYKLLQYNVPGVGEEIQWDTPREWLKAGKTTEPTINQIGFKTITDEEKELLHKLVTDIDLRNNLQFDFDSSPYKSESPLNFMDELIDTDGQYPTELQYGQYPTQLEVVGNNRIRLYRSMNGVDAAMGIRKSQYENDFGGRTSGYGSQSYFTSNAGYAYQYFGRENSDVYAIEVTIKPSEIFYMGAPIINYPEIRNELGISARDNLRFRSLDSLIFYQHDGITRERAMELLKLNGYKAILNDITGAGNGRYTTYIDNTGAVFHNSVNKRGRYLNSPSFLEDEIIIIADNLSELEYKVVGSIPVKTLDTGFHTIKPEHIKEFVPENVLQNTINKIVENAYSPSSLIGRLEDLNHQIRQEIRNRADYKIVDGQTVYSYDNSFYTDNDLKEINTLRENVSALVSANKEITLDEIKKQINFTIKDQISIETPGVWDSKSNSYFTFSDGETIVDITDPDNPVIKPDEPIYVKQSIRLPNGQQAYKHWKVIDNSDTGFMLLDEYGNTLETKYNSSFSILNFPEEKLSLYEKRFDRKNNLLEGKVLNPQIGVLSQGVKREDILLNTNLEYVLSQPYDNIIELGIVHVSPSHAISINDIRAGAQSNNVPIVNRSTGEVTWTRLGNDTRNKNLMVGMSASFEDDVVKYSYGGITGKARQGVPNYFKIRINPMNILTGVNVNFGTWFQKFDMYAAAKAINVTPETLYKAMGNTSLINVHSEGGYYAPASSRTVNNFINEFNDVIVQITGENNPTLVQKLMRGGGIDAIIDQPNLNYWNFNELMLFDPNDQVNVGRALDIVDITEQEFKDLGGQYKVVEPGTPPLRTYDSIDLNINQTALDDAYEIRLNLNKGFREAELGALGLTGELPDIINNSLFDEDTTLKILDAGERSAANLGASTGSSIDIYTFFDEVLDNAKIVTLLAEEEYYLTLGQIERLKKATTGTQYAGAATQLSDSAAELLGYHTSGSSKYRAIQLLKNKIAYSVGKRGVGDIFGGGVAGALLLVYELSMLSAAVAYGTSDAWANYFENIFKDISNNVLGTNYSMDKAEVDMEKLNKALEFSEKVSPGAMIASPIVEDISSANIIWGDKTKEGTEMIATPEEYLVTMPGYEYAPGYKTADINLYPYKPGLLGMDAKTISQGEPITRFSRFKAWLDYPTNIIKQQKELERQEKERNQWYSNYSDTYENFNEKYDRVYEQFDERVDF